MNKILLTLAGLLTALCWLSLCFDWDLIMYISGILALIVIWISDSKKKSDSDKPMERKNEI